MAEKVYIAEITAYNPETAAEEVIYVGSGGFKPFPSSDADRKNQFYKSRIRDPGTFTRSLFSPNKTTGRSQTGFGELVLTNADGELDGLVDYGFDGRELAVYKGDKGQSFSQFDLLYKGTIQEVEINFSKRQPAQIVFSIRDNQEILEQPIQINRYDGSNVLPAGLEGTEDDIEGYVKPLCYGQVYEITPQLVNTSKLVYQIHDGQVYSIDYVYDQGIALDRDTGLGTSGDFDNSTDLMDGANDPQAGYFTTCYAEGLLRLGSSPTGVVSVDAKGDVSEPTTRITAEGNVRITASGNYRITGDSGTYTDTASSIAEKIVLNRTALVAANLDADSFNELDVAAPQTVGIYVDYERTAADTISELFTGVGAFFAFTREGKLQVGQFIEPTGDAVVEIGPRDFIEIEKRTSQDVDRGIPIYRAKLNYKKIYTPQTRDQLAGAITDARAAYLALPWRSVTAEDATVQTKHLLAPELVRDTLMVDSAEAATEATRLLNLYKVRRDLYIVVIEGNNTIDLNDVVDLTLDRFDLGGSKSFRVIGIEEEHQKNRLSLVLWG